MSTAPRRVDPATKAICGRIRMPGDKSIAHRAILFNACAAGQATVTGLPDGADVASTIRWVRALGAEVEQRGAGIATVVGCGLRFVAPTASLDCGNSGTTMRLGMGVLAGQTFTTTLDGDASLRSRPMERVAEPLRAMGADIVTTGGRAPVRIVGGRLRPAIHELEIASAQVKSALMLAALQAEGRSEIVEPIATRDHSERMLMAMNATIETNGRRVVVTGRGDLEAVDVSVCGDASSSAFFVVAACLVEGSDLVLEQISLNPSRLGFVSVLQRMGADIEMEIEGVTAGEPFGTLRVRAAQLHGTNIDRSEVPSCIDELPVLAVAAMAATGTTSISGAGELRVKESDRIASTAAALRAFGASVEERRDGMVIEGLGSTARVRGTATIESAGDHRIAMAAGVGALVADGPTTIADADAAVISFPRFFDTLAELTS